MRHLTTLSGAIPPALASDFLAKLHYVSESLERFGFVDDDRRSVWFEVREDRNAPDVASQMDDVARTMCSTYRGVGPRTLVTRLDRPCTYGADPHLVLADQGQLFRYGPGRYGLGPLLVGLIERLQVWARELPELFAAEPRQFPSLVGADTLHTCRYLQSFPHSLTLVSHLREDLEAIRGFGKNVHLEGSSIAFDHAALGEVECLLSPSVCFHCYRWLAGSVLHGSQAYTATGKCFRYESGNMAGLERLWDFTMHETIFVGAREEVLHRRELSLERVVDMLDRLELSYEIQTATDPFFVEDFSLQASFQSTFELKYEIRATLPYKDATLAVGSFNYHQDFFGKSFGIELSSGAAVHTGCVGFGIERLALAVIAQHGPDPQAWPAALRPS